MNSELARIKERCKIDCDCWVWSMSVTRTNGGKTLNPSVHAMDYKLGKRRLQGGYRAVWQAKTGEPIPDGKIVYRNFKVCTNQLCLNPAHLKCGTRKQWGALMAKSDVMKGRETKIKANRKITDKLRAASDEQVLQVLAFVGTIKQASEKMGLSRHVVERIRRGRAKYAHRAGFNPFQGLYL